MKTKAIMNQPVLSCGPDTNLASVIETMRTHDCGIVPVVNERGETVGVVTDRDICIALGTRGMAASELVARNVIVPVGVRYTPEDCERLADGIREAADEALA